jgi:hypothetical protein
MNDAVVLVDRAPAPGDEVRALITPHQAEIIGKLVELAKAGDPRSIELALKYLAPPARPDAERIVVPGLREAPTIKAKSEAIINAVSNGLISVEAGEKVQRMLELHTKAVTVAELADEIAALKGRRMPTALLPHADDGSDLA